MPPSTDNSLGLRSAHQGSERLHQRGLARAGRPHNGSELTVLEVNAHIVQRVNGCFALAVGLNRFRVATAGVPAGMVEVVMI